jgi:hypothetical protein
MEIKRVGSHIVRIDPLFKATRSGTRSWLKYHIWTRCSNGMAYASAPADSDRDRWMWLGPTRGRAC